MKQTMLYSRRAIVLLLACCLLFAAYVLALGFDNEEYTEEPYALGRLWDIFPDPAFADVIAEHLTSDPEYAVWHVYDFVTPEDLGDIVVLSAAFRDISSIEGIQYLRNLEQAYLYENPIADLEPFSEAYLPYLEHLELDWDYIEDLTPLEAAHLPNLNWYGIPIVPTNGEVTVTFLPNGGSILPGNESRAVAPGTTIYQHWGALGMPLPPVASAGMYFMYWNLQADGEGAVFTGHTPVTEDMTVYAIYGHVLLFNPTPGTLPIEHTTRAVRNGFRLSDPAGPGLPVPGMPPNPFRANWTFVGWNTAQDGSGAFLTADCEIYSEKVLWAQWRPQHEVIFFRNHTNAGGFGTGNPTAANPFGSSNLQTATGANNQRSTGFIVLDGTSLGALTPARWPGVVGSGITIPRRMHTGWHLLGWNTAADGSGTWVTEDTLIQGGLGNLISTAQGTLHLYAQWTPSPTNPPDDLTPVMRTVTFHENGGNLVLPNHAPRVLPSGSFLLPFPSTALQGSDPPGLVPVFPNDDIPPTRDRYMIFPPATRWNTEADGSGTNFVAPSVTTNIANMTAPPIINEDLTVYAQWGHRVRFSPSHPQGGASWGGTTTLPTDPWFPTPVFRTGNSINQLPDTGAAAVNMPPADTHGNPVRPGWTFLGWQVLIPDPANPGNTISIPFTADTIMNAALASVEGIIEVVPSWQQWEPNGFRVWFFCNYDPNVNNIAPDNLYRRTHGGGTSVNWMNRHHWPNHDWPFPDRLLPPPAAEIEAPEHRYLHPTPPTPDHTFLGWWHNSPAGEAFNRFGENTQLTGDCGVPAYNTRVYALWGFRVTFQAGAPFGTAPWRMQEWYNHVNGAGVGTATPVRTPIRTIQSGLTHATDLFDPGPIAGTTQAAVNQRMLRTDFPNLSTAPGAVRPGHTFVGWRVADSYIDDPDNPGGPQIPEPFTADTVVTGPVTVQAMWEPAVTTITFRNDFNPDLADPVHATMVVGPGTAIATAQMPHNPVPERPGYHFVGWSTTRDPVTGNGGPLRPFTTSIPGANTLEESVFYAVFGNRLSFWTNDTRATQFWGGGIWATIPAAGLTNVRLHNTSFTLTAPAAFPTAPNNLGRHFLQWNTQADGNGQQVRTETSAATHFPNLGTLAGNLGPPPVAATQDADFYAIWGQRFVFNPGGGQFRPADGGGVGSLTRMGVIGRNFADNHVADGRVATDTDRYTRVAGTDDMRFPAEPFNVGFAFGGWFADINDLDTRFMENTTIPGVALLPGATGNPELHARWLTGLVFNATGGEFPDPLPPFDPITGSGFDPVTGQIYLMGLPLGYPVGPERWPADPVRPGYRFIGWECGIARTVVPYHHPIDFYRNLYARWEARVTFDPNGGTLGDPAREMIYIAMGYPSGGAWQRAEPTRPGHRFLGWFTVPGATGGDEVNAGTSIYNAQTLYARWEATLNFTKTDNRLYAIPQEINWLAGAQFQVEREEYCDDEGEYIWVPASPIGTSVGPPATPPPTLTCSNGYNISLTWVSTAEARYRLVEIEAPDGFRTPVGYWLIQIDPVTGAFTLAPTGTPLPPEFKPITVACDGNECGLPPPEGEGCVQNLYILHVGNERDAVEFAFYKTNHHLYNQQEWVIPGWLNSIRLAGAEFSLFRWVGQGVPAEGVLATTGSADWELVNAAPAISQGPGGAAITFDLTIGGVYHLVEVLAPPACPDHAPNGFDLPWGQWRIMPIPNTAGTDVGFRVRYQSDSTIPAFVNILDGGENPINTTYDAHFGGVFYVGNRPTLVLPLMGGLGRNLFILAGSFTLLLAVGLQAYRMKRGRLALAEGVAEGGTCAGCTHGTPLSATRIFCMRRGIMPTSGSCAGFKEPFG